MKTKLIYEKETPGTWRYKEVEPDGTAALNPLVGQAYLRKAAMSTAGHKSPPKEISITVEVLS